MNSNSPDSSGCTGTEKSTSFDSHMTLVAALSTSFEKRLKLNVVCQSGYLKTLKRCH